MMAYLCFFQVVRTLPIAAAQLPSAEESGAYSSSGLSAAAASFSNFREISELQGPDGYPDVLGRVGVQGQQGQGERNTPDMARKE